MLGRNNDKLSYKQSQNIYCVTLKANADGLRYLKVKACNPKEALEQAKKQVSPQEICSVYSELEFEARKRLYGYVEVNQGG